MRQEAYLTGKHAIVTGGGSGIGAAIAEELARLGASLTIMGRNGDRLEKQTKKLGDSKVLAVKCDVSDENSIHTAFAEAQRKMGAAHVLVNNAGQAVGMRFGDTTRKQWENMLAVNLTGTFLCTQQVLAAMLEAKGGRIINIASTAGLKGYSHIAAYCASKHGVVGLTRALAIEVAKQGITVNAVCPGYADTEMTENSIKSLVGSMKKSEAEVRQVLERSMPRGKLVQPVEVASLVGWLCAPEAGAVTGQAIAVAGGEGA